MFAGLGAEYRKLWAASAVSNLGDGVTMVAGPLLAATLTRDPVLVAGVLFAQQLPWLLFSLPGGALVDRLDRRLLMGSVDISRAALIGALGGAVFFDWASMPMMYAVFFLIGTCEVFFANSSLAILPSVVPKPSLEKANGRMFAAELVANDFAGKSLGGFLFGISAAVPFLVDAGTFAASAALVLALRGNFRSREPQGETRTSLLAEIREGLAWLFGRRLLLALAFMLGAANFAFSGAFAVAVLYAQDVLGIGGAGYGVLLACAGAGAVLGSLLAENIGRLLGTGRALSLVMLVEGLAFAAIALSDDPYFVGAMIAVDGFAAFVWNVLTFALRQSLIPSHLLGRVGSAYRLIGVGAGAIGALTGGLLAKSFGLAAPFWFAAALMTLVALASLPFVNNRSVAEARREMG